MSEREYTYECWCGKEHLVGDQHDKPQSELAPASGSTTLKTLDDVCHEPESEWASKLSNAELADELIANLWADIPARERKKAAVLETAIDRLRAIK